MGVSSKALQNEQRAVFVISKLYNFLLRNSTLLRILYWKEYKVVSIVAKRGNRYILELCFQTNLELCFQTIFQNRCLR